MPIYDGYTVLNPVDSDVVHPESMRRLMEGAERLPPDAPFPYRIVCTGYVVMQEANASTDELTIGPTLELALGGTVEGATVHHYLTLLFNQVDFRLKVGEGLLPQDRAYTLDDVEALYPRASMDDLPAAERCVAWLLEHMAEEAPPLTDEDKIAAWKEAGGPQRRADPALLAALVAPFARDDAAVEAVALAGSDPEAALRASGDLSEHPPETIARWSWRWAVTRFAREARFAWLDADSDEVATRNALAELVVDADDVVKAAVLEAAAGAGSRRACLCAVTGALTAKRYTLVSFGDYGDTDVYGIVPTDGLPTLEHAAAELGWPLVR
jgi:hypothetical protein